MRIKSIKAFRLLIDNKEKKKVFAGTLQIDTLLILGLTLSVESLHKLKSDFLTNAFSRLSKLWVELSKSVRSSSVSHHEQHMSRTPEEEIIR